MTSGVGPRKPPLFEKLGRNSGSSLDDVGCGADYSLKFASRRRLGVIARENEVWSASGQNAKGRAVKPSPWRLTASLEANRDNHDSLDADTWKHRTGDA